MRRALLLAFLAACGGSESVTAPNGSTGTGACPSGFLGPNWPTVECRECVLPAIEADCGAANDAWIAECQVACDACGEDAVCFAIYDDSEDACATTFPAPCLEAHAALEDCHRRAFTACGP